MTTTTTNRQSRANTRSLTTAYRGLWIAVLFDLLAFGVSFDADRRWHATRPFEDFVSPPHLSLGAGILACVSYPALTGTVDQGLQARVP